jgi:arginyl-tRNA synthetase
MKLIEKEIGALFIETVSKLYDQVEELKEVQIQATKDEKFGDYQTNFAMVNSKVLKNNPRSIAESIKENFVDNKIIDKIEIAGPGFINIFLQKEYLGEKIENIGEEDYDFSFLNREGDVIIDYSSPNLAKRMHIGHLRSTVIGDSIKRIYKHLGYNVIADNHIGDWGTPFGKLMVGYEKWLDKEAYAANPVDELERIYVKFAQEVENNPELEDLAREEIAKTQAGDEDRIKLWKEILHATLDENEKLYNRMGIGFDTYYGESYYNDMMPGVIEELKKKELLTVDEGAGLVFFDESENLHPCIVQKKDGAFLYSTSDLATIQFKRTEYNINKMVYVTDERQQDHFRQVFKIADMLGWTDEKVHIWFGIMRFADGIFSSRKGNVIKLSDLLDEAINRAYTTVNEKNPDLAEDEKRNIAEVVGIGAVKYADLSQNRQSAIIFEWDKILSFEGNTAPYLQYAYARIQSILRRAEEAGHKLDGKIELKEKQEKSLGLGLMEFPNVVINAANTYKPNLIADYLFETAKKFNTFYNAVSILKADDEETMKSRLLLADRTAKVLKEGLDLLGIKVVNRM